MLPHELFQAEEDKLGPIVFIHGWPDSVLLFRPFCKAMRAQATCMNVAFPGSDVPDPDPEASLFINDGHRAKSFKKATRALWLTVNARFKGRRITLVAHDWGCALAYMFQEKHPNLVKSIVTMELGIRQNFHYPSTKFFLTYAIPLALSSVLSKKRVRARSIQLKGSGEGCETAWPYCRPVEILRLLKYKPQKDVPMMFLFGDEPENKRAYDTKWLLLVKGACTRSEVCGFEGDHWFVEARQQEVCDKIKLFLGFSVPNTF